MSTRDGFDLPKLRDHAKRALVRGDETTALVMSECADGIEEMRARVADLEIAFDLAAKRADDGEALAGEWSSRFKQAEAEVAALRAREAAWHTLRERLEDWARDRGGSVLLGAAVEEAEDALRELGVELPDRPVRS